MKDVYFTLSLTKCIFYAFYRILLPLKHAFYSISLVYIVLYKGDITVSVMSPIFQMPIIIRLKTHLFFVIIAAKKSKNLDVPIQPLLCNRHETSRKEETDSKRHMTFIYFMCFCSLKGNSCFCTETHVIYYFFFELFNVDSVVRFWTMHFLCHIFSLIANDCSFNSLKVCFHSKIELYNPFIFSI